MFWTIKIRRKLEDLNEVLFLLELSSQKICGFTIRKEIESYEINLFCEKYQACPFYNAVSVQKFSKYVLFSIDSNCWQ